MIKKTTFIGLTALAFSFVGFAQAGEEKSCPDFLNHDFKKLHSSKNVNLCSLYNGKPMLIVNTASHCGFTPQFKSLEALSKKYGDKGVQVIGFASNDFNQAAKSEEEAATICYENFGVTFTMLAPTKVKGKDANAVFAYLAEKSGSQPSWNFNKYLVSAGGEKVTHYGSKNEPLGAKIETSIKKELAGS